MHVCNPTDEALMVRVRDCDDNDAYDALMSANRNESWKRICRRLTDRHQAEDVQQEVWMKIWNNRRHYDETKGSFLTWLVVTTQRTLFDVLRKMQRTCEFTYAMPDLPAGLSDGYDELVTVLTSLMTDWNEMDRTVFELCVLNGRARTEVARSLDLTPNAVYVRLVRIKARIRNELGGIASCCS